MRLVATVMVFICVSLEFINAFLFGGWLNFAYIIGLVGVSYSLGDKRFYA